MTAHRVSPTTNELELLMPGALLKFLRNVIVDSEREKRVPSLGKIIVSGQAKINCNWTIQPIRSIKFLMQGTLPKTLF